MTTNEAIGLRIKSRRKELGLTLQEVADIVGVQNSTISRYENGAINKIKLPVIEAIASALRVNPAWIVGKTDDPIDYDDGNLIAEIPLSYMEACGGDVKKAYRGMKAADEDAQREQGQILDYAQNDHEKRMLLLARHIAPIPEEQRNELIENFTSAADLYLKLIKKPPEDQ